MDAIGAAASLVALVETTVSLAKNAKKLYQAIEGAPAEIRQVLGRLEVAKSVLNEIHGLLTSLPGDSDVILPLRLISNLTLALEQSSKAIKTVQKPFDNRRSEVHASRRLRWALQEKSVTKQALNELHQAEGSLNLALQALQTRLGLLSYTAIDILVVEQRLAMDQLKTIQNSLQAATQTPVARFHEIIDDEEDPLVLNAVKDIAINSQMTSKSGQDAETFKPMENRIIKCAARTSRPPIPLQSLSWLHKLGISGTFNSYWDEHQSTYSLSADWKFPTLWGRRVLQLELKVRQYVMGQRISLPRCSLMVNQHVRHDSAIAVACRDGDEGTVRKLLRERQASPNDLIERRTYNENTQNLLQAAIESGNCNLVRYLLNAGADPNFTALWYHMTSLQQALKMGHIEISRLLVSYGADVDNIVDNSQGTANFYSPVHKSDEVIQFLFSVGFEGWVNRDSSGHSAFYTVFCYCSLDNAALLIRYGALAKSEFPLRFDMFDRGRNPPLISVLAYHGHDLSVQSDCIGWTYLHIITMTHYGLGGDQRGRQFFKYSSLEVVQQLLRLGAKADIRDKGQRTPLMFAAYAQTKDVCDALIDHGADVHACDMFGATPLHWAARRTCIDSTFHVFRNLLDQGADPHVSAWGLGELRYRGPGLIVTRSAASLLYLDLKFWDRANDFYSVFPEACVDDEDDIFWDTLEYNVTGYGASFEINETFDGVEHAKEIWGKSVTNSRSVSAHYILPNRNTSISPSLSHPTPPHTCPPKQHLNTAHPGDAERPFPRWPPYCQQNQQAVFVQPSAPPCLSPQKPSLHPSIKRANTHSKHQEIHLPPFTRHTTAPSLDRQILYHQSTTLAS